MPVTEVAGGGEREFGAAVGQAWSQTTPLILSDQEWKPTIEEGQPFVARVHRETMVGAARR